MTAMQATPGTALVPHVRVGFSAAADHPGAVVRLAGVSVWVALYDGATPIQKTEEFPPPPATWCIGPDGCPRLGLPPVYVLTADVVGADLPPSHIFRPDDLSGEALREKRHHALADMWLIKLFPEPKTAAPSSTPFDHLTQAIATAAAAGQWELVAKLNDTLNGLAGAAIAQSNPELAAAALGKMAQGSDQVPPSPGNRHDRRATDARGWRR